MLFFISSALILDSEWLFTCFFDTFCFYVIFDTFQEFISVFFFKFGLMVEEDSEKCEWRVDDAIVEEKKLSQN